MRIPHAEGMTLSSHSSLTSGSADSRTSAAPTVLKCADTADFLAALPFLTGFTAEDSLFVIAFSGKRAGPVCRLDLPQHRSASALTHYADTVVTLLQESGFGQGRPAIVIHTRERFADHNGAPWRRLARMFERGFARSGWRLRELACVAADGWISFQDSAAPRLGRPLDEIRSSPIALEAAVAWGAGASPEPLHSLGALPSGDARVQAEVRRALAVVGGSDPPAPPTPTEASQQWRQDFVELTSTLLLDDRRQWSAKLLANWSETLASDLGWAAFLSAAVLPPTRVTEGIDADHAVLPLPPTVDHLHTREEAHTRLCTVGSLIRLLGRKMPDQERTRASISAIGHATALLPVEVRSRPLALLATLWWVCGLQSVAGRLLQEARSNSPTQPAISCIADVISTPPEWCFSIGDHPAAK